jgi:hypothetical protein
MAVHCYTSRLLILYIQESNHVRSTSGKNRYEGQDDCIYQYEDKVRPVIRLSYAVERCNTPAG